MIKNDMACTTNNNWKIVRNYPSICFIALYILFIAAGLVLFSNAALATSIGAAKYDLLAGSYHNQKYAREIQMKLEEAGYSTYTEKVEIEGREFTRVIVDVNKNLEETHNIGMKLIEKGLTQEYTPIKDEKDIDLLETLAKKNCFPLKNAEISPRDISEIEENMLSRGKEMIKNFYWYILEKLKIKSE